MANHNVRSAKPITTLTKGIHQVVLEHKLLTSTGNNCADTNPQKSLVSVAELIRNFSRPETSRGQLPLAQYLALDKSNKVEKALRNREKDGRYIILGAFNRLHTRSAADMAELTGFMIDLDGGAFTAQQIRALMGNTFCLAFTTYSHHPGDPRWC